jgi:hypothetical protein
MANRPVQFGELAADQPYFTDESPSAHENSRSSSFGGDAFL